MTGFCPHKLLKTNYTQNEVSLAFTRQEVNRERRTFVNFSQESWLPRNLVFVFWEGRKLSQVAGSSKA
ncbi:Nicastrin [Manis pentadactyla]|nr:Nicastrin [Manis pentadactyla]